VSVNAGCLNFRPPPTPIPAAEAGDPPAEAWTTHSVRGASAPIATVGTIIAVAGANRRLVALSLDSARLLWNARLTGEAAGGVTAVDDQLFVGTGRPAGRIDARGLDGNLIWRSNTGQMTSPLTPIGDMIVGMNREQQIVAVNRRTGRIRWRRHAGVSRTAPADAGNGHILATTMDSLVLFESSAGREVARRAFSGVTLGGWQRRDDLLVTGTSDSSVVAIDPVTLEQRWHVRTDAPVLGPVAVSGDTVWAATRIGTIYEITGQGTPAVRTIARLEWPLTSGITLIDGDLLVGGADGEIRGFDHEGKERWRVQLWPAVDVTPIAVPGGFAAVGGDGDLHRYSR
jgi:outer membrane protein assembly factor BamB